MQSVAGLGKHDEGVSIGLVTSDSILDPMADFSINQAGSSVEATAKDGSAESESCCNNEKDGRREESLFLPSSAQMPTGQDIAVEVDDKWDCANKGMDLHGCLLAKSKEHFSITFGEEGNGKAVMYRDKNTLGSARIPHEPTYHTKQHRVDPEFIALHQEYEQEVVRVDDCEKVKVDVPNRKDGDKRIAYEEQQASLLKGQSSASIIAEEDEKFATAIQAVDEETHEQNECGVNAASFGVIGPEIHKFADPDCGGFVERKSRCNVSLRHWLSNPGRLIDKVENLHIFRQIAEFVELAHSQGVVLRNVRPSSFLLSPLSRVSIIDSASTHTSSGSSEQSTGRAAVPVSLADGYIIEDGVRDYSELSDIWVHSPTLQQRAEVTTDLEPAQQKNRGTEREFPTILSTLHADHQIDPRRQVYGISGVATEMCRPSGMLDLPDVKTNSDSQKSEDKGKETTSLGGEEERGSGALQPCPSDDGLQPQHEQFPLKQILTMEQMWYKSPEEITGGATGFYSDVYSLGVLFFELFCSSGSEAEWSRAMSDVRHRFLPPKLLLEYPKEAHFCLWLLHPDPSSRPKAREVLNADVFSEVGDKLADREAIMNLEEKESEIEITLNFLLQMQHEKQESMNKLSQELVHLKSDIEEVERWKELLKANGVWHERSKGSVSKKKRRGESSKADTGMPPSLARESHEVESEGGSDNKDHVQGRKQELRLTKTGQVMKNFTNFGRIYIEMMHNVMQPGTELSNDNFQQSGQVQGTNPTILRKNGSLRGQKSELGNRGDRVGCFFDSVCKFIAHSGFKVKAALQHGDLLNVGNMVRSLSFDCDEEFFATAGVSRKIKVFEYSTLLDESVDIHYPVIEMTSRGKLSCVCWNNFSKSHIASSDLQGAVQLWDMTMGRTLMEFKEHHRRVWSVDFSHKDPSKLASGSDDCCVKLWSMNEGTSVNTIKSKANVCAVQFCPDASHLLVFGSADHKVYCHDLRYMRIPICVLAGHSKPVSFVRFLDCGSIVSASTDSTLKLWDLTKISSNTRIRGYDIGSRGYCTMNFSGHTNEKNFVGLSVAEGGYIACGSETNEVFVYHRSLPMPMLSHKLGCADPISGQEVEDVGGQFVSSVCWRGTSQTLVVANSLGNIKVLEMV